MANIQTDLSKIGQPRYASRYLLPYQYDWAFSPARLKAWEKSIRIGATWAQAYVAVRDRVGEQGDYLHSSVCQDVAKRFIEDCVWFLNRFKQISYSLGEVQLMEGVKETAFVLDIKGHKIVSFSSNPSSIRGFGGAVGLDELAFHRDVPAMRAAAGGRAMWGHPVSMWSSHNGLGAWYEFLQEIRSAGANGLWELHRTTLPEAIEQGLVEKINETRGTTFTRAEFVRQTIALLGGQDAYDQECLCIPKAGGRSAIAWSDIDACREEYGLVRVDLVGDAGERDPIDPCAQALLAENLWSIFATTSNRLSVGYDVARNGDLAAMWVNEHETETRARLRLLVTMRKCKFSSQREFIAQGLRTCPSLVGAGDSTGLGMQVCEELSTLFGSSRFVGCNFSSLKPAIGAALCGAFEDRQQIIPRGNDDIAFDLRAIRTETSPSGRAIYTTSKNPANAFSHCDIAWACGLAQLAAKDAQASTYFAPVSFNINRGIDPWGAN